jgi:hypothetical protein
MKKQVVVLLIFLTFYVCLVQPAAAQFEINAEEIMKIVLGFIFGDYPEGWLKTNTFMQIVIFPFIALFAVMYGIMTEIGILRKAKTAKLVFALMFSFGAGWPALVAMKGFMIVNSFFATSAFGILLFIGIIFWGFGHFRGSYYLATGKEISKGFGRRKNLVELRDELRRIDLASATPGISKQQLDYLEKRAQEIRGKIAELEGEEEVKKPEEMAFI